MAYENIQHFLLVQIPALQTFPLFLAYLFIFVVCVKPWIRYTKPLGNLTFILVPYNALCSILSAATCLMFAVSLHRDHNWDIFSLKPSEGLRPVFWLYFLTKVLELNDTVFMLLRHKTRQLSMLHIYHHSSMLILGELSYRTYPISAVAPFFALNSFVHVVLYFYYAVSALRGDATSLPVAWKARVTELQIGQFLITTTHGIMGYFSHGFCVYGIFYNVSMLVMFSRFYAAAYRRKSHAIGSDHADRAGFNKSV